MCTHNEIAAFLAKCCDFAYANYVADFAAILKKGILLESSDVQTAKTKSFFSIRDDSFAHEFGDFSDMCTVCFDFPLWEKLWLSKSQSKSTTTLTLKQTLARDKTETLKQGNKR